ncbi:hypothetical protein PCC7418_2647 [Halothece sp. PCC 7418]|uniref:hypothetical protein n=1 Tax=Halothece sp. (strain PCC 7418) TaxID=65093 RepID=UPI0002A08720|nr:hypothetical protein [Halothece sp. PCC 7418]AFZ44787.1 hypothetical protein PCC7418_2647 [Halothece sp. PCC 7418]
MNNAQTAQDFKTDFLNGDWIDELIELASILNQANVPNQDNLDDSTSSYSLTSKHQ